MKRVLACILTLFFVFSLSACKNNDSTTSSDDNTITQDATEIKHTGKKISGEITGASEFSEGLAFVCIDGNKEKTYCVNQDGYIVFELDKKLIVNGRIYEKFVNGFVMIENGLCDTNGKITYPEEVGATKFYDVALKGGYIIAEKVTSDYSSAKKELGIMDTSFKWIVEPSEDIYMAIEDSLFFSAGYYYNDMFYYSENDCYLNLKTGEISAQAPFATPSFAWEIYTDYTYRDKKNNIMLDLSQQQNIYALGSFTNGNAVVVFFNQEASMYYFTLIDEKGVFAFEPVSCGSNAVRNTFYDGENTILITIDGNFKDSAAKCYNTNGELIGELSTDTLEYMSYNFTLSDGIVSLIGGYNYSNKCYYYKPDFTSLF